MSEVELPRPPHARRRRGARARRQPQEAAPGLEARGGPPCGDAAAPQPPGPNGSGAPASPPASSTSSCTGGGSGPEGGGNGAAGGPLPPGAEEAEGPGAALRRAREARGLSLEEAARQLFLKPELVRALEEEDRDRLPEPIFVTGYLRAYARLLELDPGPLVDAYRRRLGAEPPPLQQVSRVRRDPTAQGWRAWLPYLGVALVAAGLYLAFQGGEEPVPPAPAPPPVLPLDEGGAATLAPGAGLEPPEAGLLGGVVPDDEAAGDGSAPVPEEPSPEGLPEVSPAAPPEASPEASPEAVLGAPSSATPSATAPQPPADEAPPAAPAASLLLRFSAPSWVEVRDASGRRLLTGLMAAGRERRLEGEPPFSVVLGYAPGVELRYNGQPFDFSAYVRKDVARFQVGGP